MPLQPRCHTLRPDRTSGWFAFFELTRRGDRTGHFLVVGPAGTKTSESMEAALVAGQAAVRYFKEIPESAPSATLLQGAATVLDHAATQAGIELEFGCGVLEVERVWILTRGRVRLIPISPRLGSPQEAEIPETFPVGSELRFFFGRFPTELEDPRLRADLARRLEQTGGGDGGLVLSFVAVQAVRDVAPPLKPTRPVTTGLPPITPIAAPPAPPDSPPPEPRVPTEKPAPVSSAEAPPLDPALGEEPPAPSPVEPIPIPFSFSRPGSRTWELSESGTEPDSFGTEGDEPGAGGQGPGAEGQEIPRIEPLPLPEGAARFETPETIRAPAPAESPALPEEADTSQTHAASVSSKTSTAPGDDVLDAHDPLESEEELTPVATEALGDQESPMPFATESVAYAPEETRGIGFWLAAAAVVISAGALVAYLAFLRPDQSDRAGDTEDAPTLTEDAAVPGETAAIPPVLLWNQSFDEPVTSSPCLFEDKVVFGCRDGRIYALDRESGQPVWSHAAAQGFGSSPAVAADRIVIGGYDGYVYALDPATGDAIWTGKTGGRIVASPAVDEANAYIGSYDHRFYCMDLRTGRVHWRMDLGAVLWASPVVAEKKVIAGGLDGTVTAMSTMTGRILWQAGTGSAIYSSPTVAERKVLVGTEDGHVYAFHLDTGDLIWELKTSTGVNGSPTYHEGRLVVGTENGTLIGIDVGLGEVVWTLEGDGPVKSRPAVAGSRVWVTTWDGLLRGIDWRTGEEVTRFPLDTQAFSSPVLADGVAYFGGMDGRFFAVQLPPSP